MYAMLICWALVVPGGAGCEVGCESGEVLLGDQQSFLNEMAKTQISLNAMTLVDAGTLTSFSFQGPDAAAQV